LVIESQHLSPWIKNDRIIQAKVGEERPVSHPESNSATYCHHK